MQTRAVKGACPGHRERSVSVEARQCGLLRAADGTYYSVRLCGPAGPPLGESIRLYSPFWAVHHSPPPPPPPVQPLGPSSPQCSTVGRDGAEKPVESTDWLLVRLIEIHFHLYARAVEHEARGRGITHGLRARCPRPKPPWPDVTWPYGMHRWQSSGPTTPFIGPRFRYGNPGKTKLRLSCAGSINDW